MKGRKEDEKEEEKKRKEAKKKKKNMIHDRQMITRGWLLTQIQTIALVIFTSYELMQFFWDATLKFDYHAPKGFKCSFISFAWSP